MRKHDCMKENLVDHVELLILLVTFVYILISVAPPFYKLFQFQICICAAYLFLVIRAYLMPLQNYFDLMRLLFSFS